MASRRDWRLEAPRPAPRDESIPRPPRHDFRGTPSIGGLGLLVLALASLWVLGACTTAKQRSEPTSILGSLRFRGEETARHFLHNYRSGNLYLDFRPVMVSDAIFQDERYRALFLDTLRRRYLIAEKDLDALVAEQQGQFDSYFEFLVFLYGGTNTPIRLNDRDSNWKLILRDDDGDVLHPVSMQGIKVDSPAYHYIESHFSGLDRWSQVYIVRFPKLEKTVVGGNKGAKPIELLVTGLDGTITMRWENADIFYRSAAGIRIPEPAQNARGPEMGRPETAVAGETNPSR